MTHPEQIEEMQRKEAPHSGYVDRLARASRYENNLSEARMLAEDAVDLARRPPDGEGFGQYERAIAEALASIALSLAFPKAQR